MSEKRADWQPSRLLRAAINLDRALYWARFEDVASARAELALAIAAEIHATAPPVEPSADSHPFGCRCDAAKCREWLAQCDEMARREMP